MAWYMSSPVDLVTLRTHSSSLLPMNWQAQKDEYEWANQEKVPLPFCDDRLTVAQPQRNTLNTNVRQTRDKGVGNA